MYKHIIRRITALCNHSNKCLLESTKPLRLWHRPASLFSNNYYHHSANSVYLLCKTLQDCSSKDHRAKCKYKCTHYKGTLVSVMYIVKVTINLVVYLGLAVLMLFG